MSTTVVADPSVDPVEDSARSRFVRSGGWRRNTWFNHDTRLARSDRFGMYRESWRSDWRGALIATIIAVIMFFVMWLVLVPMVRSLLVPFLEGFFAFHGWWFLRFLAFILAAYFMFKTAIVTGLAARGYQEFGARAWLKAMLACFLFASVPFAPDAYVHIPPQWDGYGRVVGPGWAHFGWFGHPRSTWDLSNPPTVEPPVAETCSKGLKKIELNCTGTFVLNNVPVTVTSVLATAADGYTDIMWGSESNRGLDHRAYTVTEVVQVQVNDVAVLQLHWINYRGEAQTDTFQPPKE